MAARTPIGARRPARRSRTLVLIMLAAASMTLAACGVPVPGDPPIAPEAPRAPDDVDTLVPRDEGSAVLAAQLLLVAARAGEVRDVLRATADLGAGAPSSGGGSPADLATSRALGEEAVGLLLGTPGSGTGPGLLPALEPDRGGIATDDLITATVTLAGDVGGERSRLVLELVRDPLLGDLGAWQRDPVGVITLLRSIAATAVADGADPAALDAALLDVPGELTRALGYAFVVAGTDDRLLAAHAAQRGAGHLGVVLVAIELAVERLGAA